MKRFVALILAVLMIGALLAACGSATVTTTVSAKYDDGYAKQYADKTSTDKDGNIVYVFSQEQYDEFVSRHKGSVTNGIKEDITSTHGKAFGQYAYINDDKQAFIIGLNPGEYDESYAKEEAPAYAEKAFAYFQNLEKPVSSIKVIFCNANDQDEIYGSFTFTVE